MGGATTTRFIMTTLLTTPFPPLRPSLHLLRRSLSVPPFLTLSKIKTRRNHYQQQLVTCFHSHSHSNDTNTNTYTDTRNSSASSQQNHHPWPEWTSFLNILSNANSDNGISPDDAFVVYEQLQDQFVRAAASCLAFARDRPNFIGSLSRRDIEAVVSNGTPFLFRSAIDTARRMRAFLASDASEVEKASTVDLMKYILSYASNPTVSSESNGLYSRELVDSSIRNLLHELVTVSCGAQADYVPVTNDQFSGRVTQTFRPLGRNIEMKRGDWICTKCNFMNFARNMSCLECEEPRPRKQLTGGEWECPQCTFFNYGKNPVCLRCDCKRPGTSLFNTMNSSSGSGYNGNNHPYTGQQNVGTNFYSFFSQPGSSDSDSNCAPFAPLPANTLSRGNQTSETKDKKVISLSQSGNQSESSVFPNIGDNTQFPRDSVTQTDKEKDQAEKSKNWFQKIAELHGVKDLPSAVSNEDFPDIMPMRKGDNQFVVSKRKDRSLTSPKYKRQVATDQTDNTKFVPFVPFPPGYFAKKDPEQPSAPDSPVKAEPTGSDEPSKDFKPLGSANSHTQVSSTSHKFDSNSQTDRFSGEDRANDNLNRAESFKLTENESFGSSWTGPSLEGSAVKETDPLDMSEEAKAERWFKRVAQIKDISELSEIPDEDFPSIMPMRKGVNRFVVSKRKTPLERRLTNQQYRRNLPIVTSDPLKKENDSS